jgi:type 1 fimbria pilin
MNSSRWHRLLKMPSRERKAMHRATVSAKRSTTMKRIARSFAMHGQAFLLFVLMGIAPVCSWAAKCKEMSEQTLAIAMPDSISVPRDLPIGTPISAWRESAATPRWGYCFIDPEDSPLPAGIAFEPPPGLQKTGLTIAGPAVESTVFQTNLPGIGVAFVGKIQGYNPFEGSTYTSINLGSRQTPWPWHECGLKRTCELYGALSVVLVKTAPITSGGTVLLPSLRAALGEEAAPIPIYKTFAFTPIAIMPASCKVSDTAVDLGEVSSAQFHGVGSNSSGRNFTFRLDNCPAGMQGVSLLLHPTDGIIAGTDDQVAKLNADSSAKGVGVKLDWASGDRLKLDAKTKVDAYQGQAASIPLGLHAAYYQTDTVIRPGTANASFEVTLFYD